MSRSLFSPAIRRAVSTTLVTLVTVGSAGAPDLAAQAPGGAAGQDPIPIEGIVVTATPVPLPAGALGQHVSILDGGALRARGVTRVADALQLATGLSVARNGSFGAQAAVFVRGGESDYVLVLIDGVPVNQPGGAVDLASLTTENVERIEIVRGPTSGLYGSDAVAGVVQIITRSGGEGSGGSATIRGGTFGSTDAIVDVRGGGDAGAFALSLARYDTDGILELNNGHRNVTLSGRADIRIGEVSTARVTARLLERRYRFPTDDTGNPTDSNQSTFSEEASLGVEVDRRLGAALEVRGLVTLHDVDSGTDDAPDGPDDNSGFYGFQSLDAMRRVTADLRANYRASETTVFTAGAEAEHQRIRSFSESLSEFGPSVGRSDDSRANHAGYLHAVTAVGRVSVNGGLRVENNELFGSFVSFQAGGAAAISEGTRVRVAAGRGIKEPTFLETFATGFVTGNPDLEPERSLSWEVGVQQEVGPARFGVTWFDQSFEDLIQYTSAPPAPTDPNYYNVASADARGLELELDLPLGPAEVSAGWTWLHTEVTDSGFQQGGGATFVEGAPLIRRPKHQATLGVGGEFGRVRWNADVLWVGERSDRNFSVFPNEAVTLPSHTIANLGLEMTLLSPRAGSPALDLLLRGENLGDAGYEEAFGFQAPGRGVYIGGRISWQD
jgi:vitamin B12 transporter